MDRLFGAKLGVHFINEIDEGGVHLDFLVPPPVPHEVIERLQRLGDEFAIPFEGDVNRFLRVNVANMEIVRSSARDGVIVGMKNAATASRKSKPPHAQDTPHFTNFTETPSEIPVGILNSPSFPPLGLSGGNKGHA